MEKRAFERLTTALKIEYYYCNNVYYGTVRNLSKKGMFINSRRDIPLYSKCELRLNLIETFLKIPAKVSRIVSGENGYDGIGVEILNPSQQYLEYFNGLTFFIRFHP